MSEIKPVNVLYFTNTLSAYSETFIHRVIELFRRDKAINLHILTSNKTDSPAGDILFSGWNKFSLFERIQIKLYSKFSSRRHALIKFMAKKMRAIDVPFDLAWVDFGVNATLLYPYINKLGKKVICHVHGYDASKSLSNQAYTKELVAFSKTNYIIAPSHHLKRRLEIVGCSPDNIFVIPYSVSPNVIPKDWERTSKVQSKRLLFVGRFVEKKSPQSLIFMLEKVIKHFPDTHLIMCGEGPLMPRVKQLVKEKKLEDNVELKGKTTHDQVFEEMRLADIYVQHSVTSFTGDQEGFPNSLAESAAHALPIISTIHSGITEIVEHGKTGFLVQEHDYQSMAVYVTKLLKDPTLTAQMGKMSRSRILKMTNEKQRLEVIKRIMNFENQR